MILFGVHCRALGLVSILDRNGFKVTVAKHSIIIIIITHTHTHTQTNTITHTQTQTKTHKVSLKHVAEMKYVRQNC